MSAPNAELAYLILDTARDYDALEMGSWTSSPSRDTVGEPVTLADLTDHDCGTTACLAGWTAALAGYKIDEDGRAWKDGDSVPRELDLVAGDLLGLDIAQAAELFHCDNEHLDEVVKDIFGPRPAQSYGTGCRCDWLGEGTPEHAPSPLCISLRPDAAWHACAHRANYASAAEHDLNCPAHGVDAQAGGAQ